MDDKIQQTADQALLKLIQSLNQGQSETLKTYLRTMGKFHRYSWFNCLLIWLQRPEAIHVAGFRKWQELGRCVKKGERGIAILAPVLVRPRKPNYEHRPEEQEQEREEVANFVTAWVFDISQTEGEPLPTIGKRSGNPGSSMQRLLHFATTKGITVRFSNDLRGALGVSRGGLIELLETLPPVEQFAVLAHELAHELLHQSEAKGAKPKIVRELEAEAAAYVVCQAVGLSDQSAAVDYIHLYQGDSVLLMASLAAIKTASGEMLKAVLD
jgi:antirestriction protein ArdC